MGKPQLLQGLYKVWGGGDAGARPEVHEVVSVGSKNVVTGPREASEIT